MVRVTYKCHRCSSTIHDPICHYCGFDHRLLDHNRTTSEMLRKAKVRKSKKHFNFYLGTWIALLIGAAVVIPIIYLLMVILS